MTINTKQLLFILDNTPADQNIMLVGKHGIGKSRILEDYYTSKKMKVVILFLGQMADVADLLGLPEKNKQTGKTDFMLPYWFPTDDEPIVLFLDEINRARPELLQAVQDLTLNRKLAGKSLPKGSRIISAVNYGSEYQLTDLDPAIISRFNIYCFEPLVEDWISWATKSQVDERVINFISENPEMLDSADVEIQTQDLERTPDRRSWERLSDVIKPFSQLTELHKPLISGIIGSRTATLFYRFINEINLPSAKKMLCESFQTVEPALKNLSISNNSTFNISIFRYLENQLSGTQEPTQKEKNTISKNIVSYFDFLEANNRRELQAHFASLCNADNYPETLYFISTECKQLYEKIMALVLTI